MSKFDVVTIGGAIKDFTLYTNQGRIFNTPQNLTAQKMLAFEYGAKLVVKDVNLNFGGGGANTAVCCARLGLKTGIIAQLGNDETGQEIINHLKKERVDVRNIKRDINNPTGFSFIIAIDRKDREHVAFSCRNADEYLKLSSKNLAKIDAKWFYVTSLYGKNWLSNLKILFQVAKTKGSKIAWNPGTHQLQAGKRGLGPILKQTEVLILNKDEAIELVLSGITLGRKNPNHLNRPIYLLNILREWGPKIVVITDGAKGAWAFDGKKIYHQKAIKTKTVDTTGVGDAFGSSFMVGLIESNFTVIKALRWGAVNSAAVTRAVGAQNGLLSAAKLKEKITK